MSMIETLTPGVYVCVCQRCGFAWETTRDTAPCKCKGCGSREWSSSPKRHDAIFDANATYSEKKFQADLVRYAQGRGWFVFATWDSRHSPAGEPDLRMVRGDRFVCAELKSETGQLSAIQAHVRRVLEDCAAVEYFCWRPKDWPKIYEALV